MPPPTTPAAADPGQALLEKYETAEDADSVPADEPEAKPAAPGAVPPSTPASVAVENPPKHPASLVARARKAGFDDDDLADLSTDDLRDAVSTRQAERAAEAAATRVLNAAGRPIDPVTKQFLPQGQQPTAEAPRSEEFTPGLTAAEFEAAGYSPEFYAALGKYVAPLVAKIKGLEDAAGRLDASDRRRTAGEVVTKFDKLFSKHADVYGDQPFEELAPDTAEYERRQAVYAALNRLPADQRTTLDRDFKKAHDRLFGTVARPAAAVEPKPEVNGVVPDKIAERFSNGHVLPPTQRAGKPEPKGAKRAEATLGAKMRDLNIAQEGDTTEHDELPD